METIFTMFNDLGLAEVIGGAIAVGLIKLMSMLKDFVKGTPTKLDDKILKAVDDKLKERGK